MPPPSTNQPLYDALIVGAGPAGLAAATTLARQRQTALVLDTGVYRNARAAHLYNVPGFDHADPADVRTQAKGDLLRRYDTITFKKARITEIRSRSGRTTTTTTTTTTAHKEAKEGEGDKGGLSPPWFEAVDGAGREYRGRTVVLASGVRDVLPQEEEEEEGLEGLDACWGYGMYVYHILLPWITWHGSYTRPTYLGTHLRYLLTTCKITAKVFPPSSATASKSAAAPRPASWPGTTRSPPPPT